MSFYNEKISLPPSTARSQLNLKFQRLAEKTQFLHEVGYLQLRNAFLLNGGTDGFCKRKIRDLWSSISFQGLNLYIERISQFFGRKLLLKIIIVTPALWSEISRIDLIVVICVSMTKTRRLLGFLFIFILTTHLIKIDPYH